MLTSHSRFCSYLHYGLLAARAEVLKLVEDSETCPCLAKGFKGTIAISLDLAFDISK